MFLDNRYKRIYDRLCTRAIGRVVTGYTEKHHVLPKSLGGTNQKSNIVCLTAREHYIAHLCLVRCSEGPAKAKMVYAAFMLSCRNPHQKERVVWNSRLYVDIKTRMAAYKRLEKLGKPGKSPSLETRAKQRAAKLGIKHTVEHNERISTGLSAAYVIGTHYGQYTPRPSRAGQPIHTDESKRKIGQAVSRRYLDFAERKKTSVAVKLVWQARHETKYRLAKLVSDASQQT